MSINSEPTYTQIDLTNPLDPTDALVVQGINNQGEVVGYDGKGNAFLYSRGSYSFFDHPAAVPAGLGGATYAEGINTSGEIVGWFNDLSANHALIVSGILLPPCNARFEPQDANRLWHIGSHIWSTI